MPRYDRDDFEISSSSSRSSSQMPRRAPAPRGRAKKQRNHVRIFVNTICSVTIVFCTVVLSAIAILGTAPLSRVDIPDNVTGTINKDQINLLVMGYDEAESLSDIIMVLTMDMKNNKASILQLPRDTYVDKKKGRYEGTSKINAAYINAPEGGSIYGASMSLISNDFGIPLDGYISFTLPGFRSMIKSVGGVPIELTKVVRIKVWEGGYKEGVKIGPGPVVLTSRTAEGFMRNRDYAMGDLDRAYMQRVFYASLLKKLMGLGAGDIAKLAIDCYEDVNTNLTLGQMEAYSRKLKDFSMDSISIFTLPGQFTEGLKTKSGHDISLYSIHVDEYVELYNNHIRHYDSPITAENVLVREIFKTKETYTKYEGGSFSEVLDRYNSTGSK